MQPKIIGICISQLFHEDRFSFIQALQQHAVQKGFRLMVFHSCSDLYDGNPDDNGEMTVFRLIPYERLDAMIIFPHFLFNHPITDEIVAECKARSIPVIVIDKEIEGCVSFSFDYGDVFERLCRHVIKKHGAKNLLMMAGTPDNIFSDQRIAAFRKALEESGLEFHESMVGHGYFWEGPTRDVMHHWFQVEKRPWPDAIICANDTMAIAVSMYLQKHGCRVPEDCIVTGFDCIVQAGYYMPHLTTCQQDYQRMSGEILHAIQILSEGGQVPARNVVGFKMLLSQSCGCEPRTFDNVNDAMLAIFGRMQLLTARQDLMCTLQSATSKMRSVQELPKILMEKFVFHTSLFAVNSDIFDPPSYGAQHSANEAFGEWVNVLYHRYRWMQKDPLVIRTQVLLPELDRMLEDEEPIIICALHNFDLTLGYCAFQTEVNRDEYEKIHTFMNAINASFGAFHGRMQIQSINNQLTHVNAELEKLYVHDYLTGLFNRRGFYREFKRKWEENIGLNMQAFIISVDLDRLKYINDSFGHLEGDNAICTVAQALLRNVTDLDICARFGGDEFAVGGVLPTDEVDAHCTDFHARFLGYLTKYNALSRNPYPVEASVGICFAPLTNEFDLDRIIKIADNRMYEDKLARKAARE